MCKCVCTAVTLDLTKDEAQTLATILGRIGGPSKTSRRGHADSVLRRLAEAGFANDLGPDVATYEGELGWDMPGKIYFVTEADVQARGGR